MAHGPLRETLATIIDHFAPGGPEHGQPAVAWGAVVDGDLVLSGGVGALRVTPDGAPDGPPPDVDSVFRIASMTKSFTATALLVLRDAGKLGLDDPVARYVPELEGLRPATADSPGLTLRHLLTMSGGLPTDDPWGDRQQGLAADAFGDLLRSGLRFAWAPGTAFEYSNLGYAVLGRVVAAVAGEDYAAAVRRLVLDPLGLASTVYDAADVDPARLAVGYRRSPRVADVTTPGGVLPGSGARDRTWQELPFDPYGAFAPMGGLFSTVRDLAAWVGGFLDAFPPRDDAEGGHPLTRASRREMQQQHRAVPPRHAGRGVEEAPVPRASGYGYGLVADLDHRHGLVVNHSGGYPGFGSHMRWHPDSGVGVVVLASSTYAPSSSTAQRMLAAILDAGGRDAVLEAAGTADRRAPARPAGTASVRPPVRPAAAAPGTPWPATLAAMDAVERLLTDWDDAAVATLVAENVDLDEPLAARRERFAQAAALAGPGGTLTRDPDAPCDHESPAHAHWWLRGALGRVRLEIRLTPHPSPLVQTLSVTPVPGPSEPLARVLEEYARLTASPLPTWLLDLSPDVDRFALERQAGAVAAVAGRCRVGPVLDGDGERTATVRLDGTRASVELTVVLDAAGRVRRTSVAHPDPTAG